MNLSEKIRLLRTKNGFTQEQFAELCNVRRQSISKWEAGAISPEIEKLILLSTIFNVSVDVLVKDDLSIDCKIKNNSCHCNINDEVSENFYEGILIKESLSDETILDNINVTKVELWRTDSSPKYWTALYFSSSVYIFPELMARSIKSEGSWFVDFKCGNTKYIVFTNRILKYRIGNIAEKENVINKCREFGIPDNQLNWQE